MRRIAILAALLLVSCDQLDPNTLTEAKAKELLVAAFEGPKDDCADSVGFEKGMHASLDDVRGFENWAVHSFLPQNGFTELSSRRNGEDFVTYYQYVDPSDHHIEHLALETFDRPEAVGGGQFWVHVNYCGTRISEVKVDSVKVNKDSTPPTALAAAYITSARGHFVDLVMASPWVSVGNFAFGDPPPARDIVAHFVKEHDGWRFAGFD